MSPDTRTEEQKIADDVLIENAERIVHAALEQLRLLTPEAWERVHALTAIRHISQWHTLDISLFNDARKMALRGGPRFRDRGYRYSDDH